MAQKLIVAKTSDIAAGSIKTFAVNGTPVAIANIDGTFFAIDDTCSHARCSLGGEGFLDGNLITCGCHGSVFDVTSGKVLSLPATVDVRSYSVSVDGENVVVEI